MLQRHRIVALIVACALFMELMDATVLATALPSIAADLGVSPVSLSLAITAYVLSLALFIPLSGWLADRLGAKRVFSWAIVVFLLGSISCGLADSLWELVAARSLQGMGGAMMTPVARLILLRSVPRERLVDAVAWMGVPALLGPVMGPPLGGLLVDIASWRWIFWINLPIGLLGLFATWRYIPTIAPEPPRRFDLKGFLILSSGFLALMAGFEFADRGPWPPIDSPLLMAGGVLLLLAYWRHATRHPAPAIDLRLLRHQTFRFSLLGGLLFRLGGGALPFLMPLSLQVLHGYSASDAGLILCTTALGAIVMKAIAGKVIGRFGFRRVLVANALISAALVAAMGLPEPRGLGLILLLGILLVGGFFRSLQFTSFNTLAFAEVSEDRMGDATAFNSVVGQVAMALGVAFAALLLTVLPAEGLPLDEEDFSIAFLLVGMAMAFSALMFGRLSADAGSRLSRHRTASAPGLDRARAEGLESRP